MNSDANRKEAMQRLRQERRPWIVKAAAEVKRQEKARQAILDFLENISATIPQIAAGTGIPSHQVLWFVATMKKYGVVVEDGQDENYYRYATTSLGKCREDVETGEQP